MFVACVGPVPHSSEDQSFAQGKFAVYTHFVKVLARYSIVFGIYVTTYGFYRYQQNHNWLVPILVFLLPLSFFEVRHRFFLS